MKIHDCTITRFRSTLWLLAATFLALVVTGLPGAPALAADNPMAAAMTIPPPFTDPALLGFKGTWEGDSKFGDMTAYTELVFTAKESGQWLEGDLKFWTDKTKKKLVSGLMFYVRPGASAGNYKAVSVGTDGSAGSASITVTNGVMNWGWAYDNDTKETATLTHVTPDHWIYEGSVSDKTGAKLVDIKSDMTRRMSAATTSHTPKKH